MDVRRNLRYSILALAIVALASSVMPAGAFIGAGINLNKHLGDTVNFNLNPLVAQAAGARVRTGGLWTWA